MIIWVAILHPYPILSANPVAQEVIYPDRTPGEAVVAESIAARELQTSENADEMIVATGAPNYFDVFFHGNGRVAMIGGTWQESRAGLFPPVNTSHGVASSPTMWNRSYTWEELDYLVLTTNYMNRGLHPEAIQRCFYDAEPIEKITANGYVVARVYDADSCTPTFDTGVSRSNNVTMTAVPTP